MTKAGTRKRATGAQEAGAGPSMIDRPFGCPPSGYFIWTKVNGRLECEKSLLSRAMVNHEIKHSTEQKTVAEHPLTESQWALCSLGELASRYPAPEVQTAVLCITCIFL